MPHSTERDLPAHLVPEDNLPEVRPPSAGFILQLFVIPGVVVLMLVLVWLLFTWLAHMGGNPASYVREMKEGKSNSWQQALNLAEELHQNAASRRDAALAKEVADYLDQLLSQPLPPATEANEHQRDPRSEEVARRGFLCRALGEFEVADDPLPVLLKAAAAHRNQDELKVRRAALEAIAVLADNVRTTRPLANPRLLPILTAASRDETEIIAVTGTFALGVVGGREGTARLKEILREAHPAAVQYNAAIGLARHGDAGGMAELIEMIDPASDRGLKGEEEEDRAGKRALLQINALRAARELAAHNTRDDLRPLVAAIEKLEGSDPPGQVKSEAAVTRRALSERPAPKARE